MAGKSAEENGRSLPAYRRIASEIQQRIEAGDLKVGDAIDSERDLARVYGVSLMTARHALKDLEADGIVTRRAGVGTFVAPPRIHFNKLLGFTEQMVACGFTPNSRLLSTDVVDDEHEVAARLALPAGSSLVKVQRLRLGNTEPFALETCYLDAKCFAGILNQPLDRRSLFHIIEDEYQLRLAYADEEVDATSADANSAAVLAVVRGAPLLRVRQALYSTAASPLVYSLALYRSDRHSLLVRRFR